MPVDASWHLKPRIIRMELRGDVTLPEIAQASEDSIAMMSDSSVELVHVLHDCTALDSLPIRLKDLNDTVKDSYTHPQLGWIVAFDVDNAMFQFVGNLTGRLFGIRYRIVDTEADALQWLQEVDSSLPTITG
jgi:hypothetical protein